MTATVTTVSGMTVGQLRLVAPVDEAGRQVEQEIDDARRSPSRPSRRANSFSSFGPMPGSADSGANSGLSTGGRIELPLTFAASPSIYRLARPVRAFGVGLSPDCRSAMTERSSEGLDERRRRLLFRAWRRGVREIDLIVGRFADAHIDTFDAAGLDDFERLIEAPNAALYAWVTGTESRARRLRHRGAARSSKRFTRGANHRAPGTRHDAQSYDRLAVSPAAAAGARPAAAFCPASPTAPKAWCWPISRARSPRAATPPAISLAVVCRDGPRMATLSRALAFFAPEIEVLEFPAWDCLPYDRVSPHAAMVAQRMTDAGAARPRQRPRQPAIVLTTVNAISAAGAAARDAGPAIALGRAGQLLPMAGVTQWLELNGFNRASTVREPGDYAVRGGIVDLFAPGMDAPVRLDFFGDTLESIRSFDPETPAHHRRIAHSRSGADGRIPAHAGNHPAVPHRLCRGLRRRRARRRALRSGERRPPRRRHRALAAAVSPAAWRRCSIICRQRPVAIEPLAEEAAHERLAQIADYYQARKETLDQPGGGAPYKPLPPDRLYLAEAEWRARLDRVGAGAALAVRGAESAGDTIEIGAHAGHNFTAERSEPGTNVFEAVKRMPSAAGRRQARGHRAVERRLARTHVACARRARPVQSHIGRLLAGCARPARAEVALAVLGLDSGFETQTWH